MGEMKKHLMRDVRPQEQPPGTYPFAKNGILHDVKGAMENEPGFTKADAVAPYKVHGIIESHKFPIIFSTDNTNSAIGYFDPVNDLYIPIIDDSALAFKLGFNVARPITGQAAANYLGETVVAFTDGHLFPMYLNCDNPQVTVLDDLRLHPVSGMPVISPAITNGGQLLPGAYYVAVKLAKDNGAETAFSSVSDVRIVSGTANIASDKALEITLTQLDTAYQKVIIAIISKINGVTKAIQLPEIPYGGTGTVNAVFTGENVSTDITLEEVLIPPAAYSKVGSIGQLNDALYIGKLEKYPEIDMQKYALLVNLQWTSNLQTLNPIPEDIVTGKLRGFMHREVYAFYIQYYNKKTTEWSRAFHIAGPAHTATSNDTSTLAGAQGITAKKYQVEDTVPVFDPINKTGTCGVWYNENELYPNDPSFNATSVGGPDLRNQPVRHHRMPSIRWCKENLYNFEPQYGKDKLDVLGIKVTNIIIPAEYQDTIGGYRILYGKRTLANSTVIAQSLTMAAGRKGTGGNSGAPPSLTGPDTDYVSTGGNWHVAQINSGTVREQIAIDRKLLRFHAFDLLFNKPSISPNYVVSELKLQVDGINTPYLEDYSITPSQENGPIAYLVDYLTKSRAPVASAEAKLFRRIVENQYAPNDLVSGKWKNTQLETAYAAKLNAELLDSGDLSYHRTITGGGVTNQPEWAGADKEIAYLSNLMNLREDLYAPFTSQILALAGTVNNTNSSVLYGGDTFVNDYSFHTYGYMNLANMVYGGLIGGIKVARRFACEAASNINSRYFVGGNNYSKWYPKFPLVNSDPGNYLTYFDRTQDPNQFGYTRDLNSINDLLTSLIFNPNLKVLYKFPYRIHRGGKLGRQAAIRSWQNFLALDYYEMQKNMGEITHVEGMDDRLIIHCENAMFLTQDKAKLEGGLLSVTLGSGDIFQFEPQEALSAKLGYAGTQHNLACVRTPLGYVFIDSKQGHIFQYKGQLSLINEGLNTFFRDFLRIKENNPFIGNGYTISYDPDYKRIILTCKNLAVKQGRMIYGYEATPEFISSLTPGDFVYKDGRWQKFLGVNATQFSCPDDILPDVTPDQTFSVDEDSSEGTVVGTISGTDVLNMYISAGNTNNAFRINPATRELIVNNPPAIDFEQVESFILTVTGQSPTGDTVSSTVTVNVNDVVEPPFSGNFEFYVAEDLAEFASVGTVTGVGVTSFAITGGNEDGQFAINGATGEITKASAVAFDFDVTPRYELSILLTGPGGTLTITAAVNIEQPLLPVP